MRRRLDGLTDAPDWPRPQPQTAATPPQSVESSGYFWPKETVQAMSTALAEVETLVQATSPRPRTRQTGKPKIIRVFERGGTLAAELTVAAVIMFVVLSLPSYLDQIKNKFTLVSHADSLPAPTAFPLSAEASNRFDPFGQAGTTIPGSADAPAPNPVAGEPDQGDNRLMISSLDIDTPLLTKVPLDQADDALHKGVVQLDSTSDFSGSGATLVAGHSSTYPWDQSQYGRVFASLPNIAVGSEISVRSNGRRYTYRVSRTETVKPDAIILPGSRSLVLMTCVPVGTTKNRLLVIADPV